MHIKNPAKCHPDKKAHAKGLCAKCYWKSTYNRSGFEKYRDKRYLKEYGITLKQYNEMLAYCDFKCEICGKPHKEEHWERLCVDHNHATGKVRGLLCDDCNQAIGRVKENIPTILKIISYLELHNK
jgi:hypothetical protein